jgi:CDP-diacylglycerol--glycerol-3-phosphate 3-phosphatidyltransferase
MVMIILGRELAVTALRNVAAGRGILIGASSLGKGKMVSQVVAIFLLLLSRPFPQLRPLALVSLWVVVGLTLVSGVDYFVRFWRDVVRSPARPLDEAKPFGPPAEARLK